MPTIRVDEKYCKGCELCLDACPRRIIELDMSRLNAKGYHPAGLKKGSEDKCTGCASCAAMCPDCAIIVER